MATARRRIRRHTADRQRPAALFEWFPRLQAELPWIGLVRGRTPVDRLSRLGRLIGQPELWVKRESHTDTLYGGNKVRNLEFLIGAALAERCDRLVTLAPLGSNFVAALAAQAGKLDFPVTVHHFTPAASPQIEAHRRFAQRCGARLQVWRGRRGALPAALRAAWSASGRRAYWIAPGGSSPVGALGHVNAALELALQIRRGELPAPSAVVVGVGTCGTMAGLLVGFHLAQLRTRVIGVRCVDRLVCTRGRVARLANRLLERLGARARLGRRDVRLVEAPGGYGTAGPEAIRALRAMRRLEGIRLDTTYTAKVVAALSGLPLPAGPVLYWHTFTRTDPADA